MAFSLLIFLHVSIAAIGLASGAVALFSQKGDPLHRLAGRVFLVSMLAMTAIAFVIAIGRDDRISIVPAMLTFYLVATGWRTVTRRPAGSGALDLALLVLALATGASAFLLGWGPAHAVTGLDNKGFPAAPYFIFGSIAVFAAGLDVRTLMAGGLRGGHRLARHLWRMCLAMLIATTSFFQGQEQVFPTRLHGSLLLKIPALAVIAMLFYWLLRLGIGGARRSWQARARNPQRDRARTAQKSPSAAASSAVSSIPKTSPRRRR
ncbi:MAG: hypothetical protein ABI240_18135 [Sphingomonas sp.]